MTSLYILGRAVSARGAGQARGRSPAVAGVVEVQVFHFDVLRRCGDVSSASRVGVGEGLPRT